MNKDSTLSDYLKEREEELNTLRAINAALSDPVFVPTGSRAFKINGLFSDFDYFIKFSEWADRRTMLLDLGFTRSSRDSHYGPYFDDPSLAFLIEYKTLIDVQVIRDTYYDAKVAAAYMIGSMAPSILEGYSKLRLAKLWNTLIQEYKCYSFLEGENDGQRS